VVYDFAVQLDLGDSNIKFMPSLWEINGW
jgi:hypothetical protein